MTMYRDKRAVLFVSDKYYKLDGIYKQLLSHGVFDEVIYAPFYPRLSLIREDPSIDADRLATFIVRHFDRELYRLDYTIYDFFQIVLLSDENLTTIANVDFEIYLILKQVRYLFFGMTDNQFRNPKNFASSLNPALIDLLAKTQAFYGRSPYATVFYPGALFDGFTDRHGSLRLRYYLLEEIKLIKDEDRKRILQAYDYSWEPPKTKNNVFFALQGRAFTGEVISKDKEFTRAFVKKGSNSHALDFLSAQNIIDYFVDENQTVYLKSHPNTPITKECVVDNFNNDVKVLSKMPIQFYEFEPSIRDFKFDTFVEYGSKSSSALMDHRQGYFLGKGFPKCIPVINRIWFAVGLLYEILGVDEPIGVFGIKSSHIKPFTSRRLGREVECSDIKNIQNYLMNPKSAKVLVIKDFESVTNFDRIVNKIVNKDILVVLNGKTAPRIKGFHTLRFVITKEALKKKRICTLREEEFYILVKDDSRDLRAKVLNYVDEKYLKMVGVKLTCLAADIL